MQWSTLFEFFGTPVIAIAVVCAVTVALALLVQDTVTRIVARLIAHRPFLRAFLRRSVGPMRLLLPLLALQTVLLSVPARWSELAAWHHAVLLGIIYAVTWLAVQAVLGVRDVVSLRLPVNVENNLSRRRVLTQSTVLARAISGIVVIVGAATALTTFPAVRQIGASLLASAGLAGIVVGFAARPVLGNLIAGLQIALAQPIRIDDVVIVEGEWGRIEDITGAYVVVKIWDERRLIVPLQWFIENPFQNWTYRNADILGPVYLWADYRLPLEPLRHEMARICETAPEWDGRVCTLQVVDASDRAVQLRALASAGDAGRSWDLKCRIREGLIAFIQRHHAEALPHLRAELTHAAPPHGETAVARGATDVRAMAKGRATPETAN